MTRNTKNKIRTVHDVRAERIAADVDLPTRKPTRKVAFRMPHERADKLHPRIGTLNRWDETGMPFYYIIDDGIVIESTNLDHLARIAEEVTL